MCQVARARKSAPPAFMWDQFEQVLTVGEGRRLDRYRLTEAPGGDDLFRHVRVEKLTAGTDPDSDSYLVVLPADPAMQPLCTCRGHTFHRVQCRHLAGVAFALANGGFLPPEPAYNDAELERMAAEWFEAHPELATA